MLAFSLACFTEQAPSRLLAFCALTEAETTHSLAGWLIAVSKVSWSSTFSVVEEG